MKNETKNAILALTLISTLSFQLSTFAQGTAFTYQGRLTDGANPANGSYDLRFVLYTADPGGGQVGPIQTNAATAVSNGLFIVTLDFGVSIFTGADRYLEIAARPNGGGAFTTLSPRQKLTPAPYAIFAASSRGLAAGVYPNAVLFNNLANSFYGDGLGLVNLSAAQLSVGTVPDARLGANIARLNQVWNIGGNAGTSSDFVGTTDDQPFDIRVNNVRAMRYRLGTDPTGTYTNSPNVIGGSSVNSALTTVIGATIGGGGASVYDGSNVNNRVTANFGTIAGGAGHLSSDDYATVGGGTYNTSSGYAATVSGGWNSTASGDYAVVPGGQYNVAAGAFSFAGGYGAHANHNGSFVWSDDGFFPFASTTANQFRVRSTGGAAFVTAIDGSGGALAGVHVLSGDTAWSSISDRNAKKNFAAVSGEAVLEKLAAMPVQSWNYKWESDTNTPHLGPMAQDFKAAFYPGRDDKSISTLEFDGVELAAIQGLNQKLEAEVKRGRDKDTQISMLQERLARLEAALTEMTKIRSNSK